MNALTEVLIGLNAAGLLLLKLTLILMAGVAGHWALRWSPPQWRVLLWRATLVGIVVAVLSSAAVPAWEIGLPRSPSEPATPNLETVSAAPQTTLSDPSAAPFLPADVPVGATAASVEGIADRASAASVALSVWLMVAVLLLALWTRSYVALARLRRGAEPASGELAALAGRIAEEMRFSGKPEVLVSDEIRSPCSVSVLKPVILVPNPDDPDMEAILAHEIAHLRSRDLSWIWLMDWLVAVFWFHPLCWLMRREHLFACEATSDAAAAGSMGDRESYSAALARIAVAVCGNRPVGALSMARSSDVMRRLRLLRRPQWDSQMPRWKTWIAMSLAATMALAMGAMQFALADEEKPEPHSAEPIVGVWQDDRGGWHRFAPNGWYIELRGDVRTFEDWSPYLESQDRWRAGNSAIRRHGANALLMRREGPLRELVLTRGDLPTEEVRSQLASESSEDQEERKRLQGIWVARKGEYGVGPYETWVRFADDGSFTKVHWSDEGFRPIRGSVPPFRLARFRDSWTLNNRLLDGLGASLTWRDDRSFIAQLKSYDDSGIWDGKVVYERAGDQIPEEVRDLLLAEPNEAHRRALRGSWISETDGGSVLTFNSDGTWRTDDGGQRRFGRWEVTDRFVIMDGYRIHRILRLGPDVYRYHVIPASKANQQKPPTEVRLVRWMFRGEAAGETPTAKLLMDEDPGKSFRGLDLTKAPSTTKSAELPEIWEARPAGSESYHIRRDVIAYLSGFAGSVYFVPASDRYYVQSDPIASSTMTFYGPFQGNPFETLKLADDIAKEAQQSKDAELAERAKELVDRFAASGHEGLERIAREIRARWRVTPGIGDPR